MDRPDINEEEKTDQASEEPITLEIQDGFIGGDSAFQEGD